MSSSAANWKPGWRAAASFFIASFALIYFTILFYNATDAYAEKYQRVLSLNPTGYWPADEGEGTAFHDRSGNENHGQLHHVDWDGELLDFHSCAYQWAEIPHHPHYLSQSFTTGGWIFTRRDGYVTDRHQSGMSFFGHSQTPWHYISGWWEGSRPGGFKLRLAENCAIDVLSAGRPDAIDSRRAGIKLEHGSWQHIIYTYEKGRAVLYLNGRKVKESHDVPYNALETAFLIGTCGSWWMVWPAGESQSLDGSVRDIVWFDRVLDPSEIQELVDATKPESEPRTVPDDAILIDNRRVAIQDLDGIATEDLQRALEELEQWDTEKLRAESDTLLPVLEGAADDWRTRRAAAALLAATDSNESREVLDSAVVPVLKNTLLDRRKPHKKRAQSALGLIEISEIIEASRAVPPLVEVVEELLQTSGARLPHIEDHLRNASIKALMLAGEQDETARETLGRALARPVLESIDLELLSLQDAALLQEEGRYLDALDEYRRHRMEEIPDISDWDYWREYAWELDDRLQHFFDLPVKKEHENGYFTQGNPYRDARRGADTAYTPLSTFQDEIYAIGLDPVPREEYNSLAAEISDEYPEVKNWPHSDSDRLSRVEIAVTDQEGHQKQRAVLAGDWFIFRAHDKLRGWSIGVDRDGYIHVTGGKHTTPNPNEYIPGSWERIGASRNRGDDNYPTMLYWVSEKPGDIETMQYLGQRDNPRNVPVHNGMCYMNFVRDNNGVLFLFGRVHDEFGNHSWGLYRYEEEVRRWTTIGGHSWEIIQSAQQAHPGWQDHLIRDYRGGRRLPDSPGVKTAAWAWQPHFYNFCRDQWAVRFDRNNRMHIKMQIRGLDENTHVTDSRVYAYSDDLGESFRRADGTEVKLPLTINPSPVHNADIQCGDNRRWWELWHDILRYTGYQANY